MTRFISWLQGDSLEGAAVAGWIVTSSWGLKHTPALLAEWRMKPSPALGGGSDGGPGWPSVNAAPGLTKMNGRASFGFDET